MSMIFNLIPAPVEELQALLDSPDGVMDYIYGEEELGGGALDRAIDLDKAWHGVHFLLAGEVWGGTLPAATLMAGGRSVGEVDVGYGPARVLTPAEVAAFSAHIGAISDQAFEALYDADALTENQIYPDIWARDWDDEENVAVSYLVENFRALKVFFAEAEAAGQGVLIVLN